MLNEEETRNRQCCSQAKIFFSIFIIVLLLDVINRIEAFLQQYKFLLFSAILIISMYVPIVLVFAVTRTTHHDFLVTLKTFRDVKNKQSYFSSLLFADQKNNKHRKVFFLNFYQLCNCTIKQEKYYLFSSLVYSELTIESYDHKMKNRMNLNIKKRTKKIAWAKQNKTFLLCVLFRSTYFVVVRVSHIKSNKFLFYSWVELCVGTRIEWM